MDDLQRVHERTVGDSFIRWYNHAHGRRFLFNSHPREAPDLLYRDSEECLQIEVSQAYYDADDAAMKWKGARGDPDAPQGWDGINFNDALIQHVSKIIVGKC